MYRDNGRKDVREERKRKA